MAERDRSPLPGSPAPAAPEAAEAPGGSLLPILQQLAAPPEAPGFHAGALVGRYTILGRLGAGGMGEVYRASDARLGREVAIKVLSSRVRENPESHRRFQQEALAIGRLSDPNVLAVFDVGDHEGYPYLVTELLQGGTLRQRLGEGPLTMHQAIGFAAGIARALSAAHRLGVVHRDLKPENVFVTASGHVKVLDFGLAKSLSPAALPSQGTVSGTVLGTVGYMSPEQVRGEAVDARADLFSLGAVLYEMLCGRRAFQRGSAVETLHAILHDPLQDFAAANGSIPPALEQVVRRCLEKRPEDRFQSAEEVAAALAAIDPSSQGDSLPWTAPRGRRRRVALAGGLSLLALLAGAAGLWLARGRSAPVSAAPDVVAVLPFTVRGSGQYDYLAEGMVDLLHTSFGTGGSLRVVDTHALLSFLAAEPKRPLDLALANSAAAHFGAGRFVLGTIVAVEQRLQMRAELYTQGGSGAPDAEASVDGAAGQVFELVEDLVTQLRPKLAGADLRIGGARMYRLAQRTTTSGAALKAYLEGESAFRRGDGEVALKRFQDAVEADPSFALAYYGLARAQNTWGDTNQEALNSLGRALALAAKLPPDDRKPIEAFQAFNRADFKTAERLYGEILAAHLDDVEARHMLADSMFHGRPLSGGTAADSRAGFEATLLVDPHHARSLYHLIRIATVEGRFADLPALIARLKDPGPLWSWLAAKASGDAERARQIEQSYLDAPDLLTKVGYAAFLEDGLEGATRFSRANAHDTSPRRAATAHVFLAELALAGGRWSAARDELAAVRRGGFVEGLEYFAFFALSPFLPLDRAELAGIREELRRWSPPEASGGLHQFAPFLDPWHVHMRLYLLGLLSARLGEPQTAAGYAADLERLPTDPNAPTIGSDLASSVRAHAAAEQGQDVQAWEALERVRGQFGMYQVFHPFVSGPLDRLLRAQILRRRGQDREALNWLVPRDVWVWEQVYLSPALLAEAEIREKLGEPQAALRAYSRFVQRWKDCDPALRPVLREAERRLDLLRRSNPGVAR